MNIVQHNNLPVLLLGSINQLTDLVKSEVDSRLLLHPLKFEKKTSPAQIFPTYKNLSKPPSHIITPELSQTSQYIVKLKYSPHLFKYHASIYL